MTKRIVIPVDERGNRLGQFHHHAKLTDDDAELIRAIYEEGMESMGTLAKVFGVCKGTIQSIIEYRKRATTPADYRTVREGELKRPLPLSRLKQLGVEVEECREMDRFDDNH